MKVIYQDMLALKEGVLFHQVNCQGVMGGGIARAFALRYPGLEKRYQGFIQCYMKNLGWSSWSEEEIPTHWMLGQTFLFEVVPDKLYIANVFGQDSISRSNRMTSYDATVEAFERIVNAKSEDGVVTLNGGVNTCSLEKIKKSGLPLYFPYRMGCGLGGGNWNIYSAIIEAYFPAAIICQHE